MQYADEVLHDADLHPGDTLEVKQGEFPTLTEVIIYSGGRRLSWDGVLNVQRDGPRVVVKRAAGTGPGMPSVH